MRLRGYVRKLFAEGRGMSEGMSTLDSSFNRVLSIFIGSELPKSLARLFFYVSSALALLQTAMFQLLRIL